MASFYSVLGFLSVSAFDASEPGSFDMIATLPLEVASTILRLLPSKDLLNAACVSKTWMKICKSDIKLRRKLRLHLRRMRKDRLRNLIREENHRRRVVERSEPRAAMTALSNFPLKKENRSGSDFICRDERTQFRFKPYFKGRAEKVNFATEKILKGRYRM